jgi:hypothetical protein
MQLIELGKVEKEEKEQRGKKVLYHLELDFPVFISSLPVRGRAYWGR